MEAIVHLLYNISLQSFTVLALFWGRYYVVWKGNRFVTLLVMYLDLLQNIFHSTKRNTRTCIFSQRHSSAILAQKGLNFNNTGPLFLDFCWYTSNFIDFEITPNLHDIRLFSFLLYHLCVIHIHYTENNMSQIGIWL